MKEKKKKVSFFKNKILLSFIVLLLIIVGFFLLVKFHVLTGKVIGEDYSCKDCNVIVVSIDTLRADHLPCYGYDKNTAPNICKLAEDSIIFDNSYSVSAWTFPPHYAMFTSKYPASGNLFLLQQIRGFNNSTNSSLPQVMKENGYQTAGFTGGVFVTKRLGFGNGFDLFQENKKGLKGSFWDHEEGLYNWMYELNQSEPFFLFLHGYDVHSPYKVPADLKTKFLDEENVSADCLKQIKNLGEDSNNTNDTNICNGKNDRNTYQLSQYDAEIYYVDEFIGELVSQLKKLGLYDKTVIVITADHGDGFGEHGEYGHVSKLYQELIKVPFIIHVPNTMPKKIDADVSNLDLMPTILDITGLPNNLDIDGKSLLPVIYGDAGRKVFSLTGIVKNSKSNDTNLWFSMINEDSKVILNNDGNKSKEELFNLNDDPKEKSNLVNSSDYSDQLGEMNKDLSKWIKELNLNNLSSQESDFMKDEDFVSKLKSLGYLN